MRLRQFSGFLLLVQAVLLSAVALAAESRIKAQYVANGLDESFPTAAAACNQWVKMKIPGGTTVRPPADDGGGGFSCFYKYPDGSESDLSLVGRVCPRNSQLDAADCVCNEGYAASGEQCVEKSASADAAGPGLDDDGDDGPTCRDQHAEMTECFECEGRLPFPNHKAAEDALRKMVPGGKIETSDGKGAKAEECDTTGLHWNYTAKGRFVGSVLCCDCCRNTKDQPVLEVRCTASPNL